MLAHLDVHRDPCQPLHQAHVQHDRLEPAARPHDGRQAAAGNGADARDELRALQNAERRLGGGPGGVRGESRVLELRADRPGGLRQHVVQCIRAHARPVLGEVVPERGHQQVVDVRRLEHAAAGRVGSHGRRHPAHAEVVAEQGEKRGVTGLGQRLRATADDARRDLVTDGAEELREAHRVEPEVLDPPDGERSLPDRELEQRSRRYDMQLRHLLEERPQRHDRPGACLDLVEEQEVVPGDDATTKRELEVGEDPGRGEVAREHAVEVAPHLQIDRDGSRREPSAREVRDEPCLAHLTSAADEQRPTAGSVRPAREPLCRKPQHGSIIDVTI